jgi:RhtB (resistance to homoserine/threonine) family protein
MIEFLPLLKIAPIFLLALASPGPDFVFVSSQALSRGRGAGLLGAAGITFGITLYVALSVWGLAALFDRFLWLAMVVKLMGGCYLVYIGYSLWKSSATPLQSDRPQTKAPGRKAFLMGILTSLTNPKSIAFFSSIFALILTPNTSFATQVVIVAGCSAMALGWFAFVALLLSTPHLKGPYGRSKIFIDRAAGTVIGFFGLTLLASAVKNR